jgi:hypothetical protein
MGCGCGRSARAAVNAPNGYQFEMVPAGGGEPLTFLTHLEANRARRNAGGGTISRVPVPPPSTSDADVELD